ncbi:Aste57867_3192 [Aphanomyces stellatus]|uniref:Aste57867_3192 protein n=1 Tax=Aphanomyces stellatus TaxID=120398 RepID=A0A485KDH8_9STRA|nr:hypothetical protein As57867_003183 [Aphanomyces stellatus]VFT80366.1 Aste57867_3192 [Aphanomyces stellatus]
MYSFHNFLCSVTMAVLSYTGHLLLYAAPSTAIAIVLGSAFAALFFIFSGFMIDGNTLAKGWQWVYWMNPMHYMLEMMIMAQYHDQTKVILDTLTQEPISINAFVLQFFNGALSFDNIWRDLGLLWAVAIAIQLLIFFCMAKVNHATR